MTRSVATEDLAPMLRKAIRERDALHVEIESWGAIKARALVIARNEGLSVVQRHAARIILYGTPNRPVAYEASPSRVHPLIDGDSLVEHLLTDGTLCLVDGPHRRADCTFHGHLRG